MVEESQRFQIKNKVSYEEQINEEEKVITMNTVWLGLAGAATLCCASCIMPDSILAEKLLYLVCTTFGATGFSITLRNLIQSISRKTMLEGKVMDEDIDRVLSEEPEMEESRGMKR